MLEKELNSMSTKEVLKTIPLETRIKMIIPDNFLDKVKFLCKNIPKVEWSGVLFYEVEGSIKKPEKMKIICRDIYLMDKGSSTYTEYDFDETIINYRMEHPETMSYLIGHIHSHNVMNVFFSGTDMSELEDNSPNHNFYVSLIVNNFMDMTAKVSFVGNLVSESIKFNCKDEQGNDYELFTKAFKQKIMFVYDCDIQKKVESITVSEEFSNRLEEINKQAKEKAERNRVQYNSFNKISTPVNDNYNKPEVYNSFEKYMEKNYNIPNVPPVKNPKEIFDEISDDYEDIDVLQDEAFAAYVLRLGNYIENDHIEDAIEDVEVMNLNVKSFINSVIENFSTYYTTFYDKDENKDKINKFLDVLENVVIIYNEYSDIYPILEKIASRLQELGNKVELELKKNG